MPGGSHIAHPGGNAFAGLPSFLSYAALRTSVLTARPPGAALDTHPFEITLYFAPSVLFKTTRTYRITPKCQAGPAF